MLHIISTDNEQILEHVSSVVTPSDILLAFENISAKKVTSFIEENLPQNTLLIVKTFERDSKDDISDKMINYDAFVELCMQHKTIQNWY